MRRRGHRLAVAVALDAVGSGAALVLLSLSWSGVRIDRAAPFAPVTADVAGRAAAPAVFGLALVTAAGAVAALATSGWARRAVGVVVVLAGLAAAAAALAAIAGPSAAAARRFAAQAVADRAGGAGGAVIPITDGRVEVTAHPVWPALAAVAALLAAAAGVLLALPGRPAPAGDAGGTGAPDGLGARYDAPVAEQRPRDASLWSALDHGDDPTLDLPARPDLSDPAAPAEPPAPVVEPIVEPADAPDPISTGGEQDLDPEAGRNTAGGPRFGA